MRQIPIQPLKRKCSGCGDIMTITKSDYHNNYILFDGKLYHKDCYFKTKTITKNAMNARGTSHSHLLQQHLHSLTAYFIMIISIMRNVLSNGATALYEKTKCV